MSKKFLYGGATALVLGFVVFGTSLFGHLSQGVSWVRGEINESIPVEYELARARDFIEKSEPRMRKCKREIAEKQVEIKYLERDLSRLKSQQDRSRGALIRQASFLETDDQQFHFARRVVSRPELERDAALRLQRVKAADKVIHSKESRLGALKNGLVAVKNTLQELAAKREELMASVELLEAKRRETETKRAMTLDLDVEDGNLAQALEILKNVEKRLDVDIQVMENNRPLLDESRFEEIGSAGVQEEISAYLNRGKEVLVPQTAASKASATAESTLQKIK